MSRPMNRLAAEQAWREAFAGFEAGPPWLRPAREAAFAAFEKTGLPAPRAEDWRWSDIHRHLASPFPPAMGEEAQDIESLLARNPFAGLKGDLMVYVNGRFAPEHSLARPQAGVDILSLSVAQERPDWLELETRDDAIDQLNMAFATDGALIRVAPDVAAERPLVILNISTGEGVSHALRHAVRVDEGASFSLFEAHIGAGPHLASVVTHVRLDEGAALRRINLDMLNDDVIALANLDARVQARGNLHDLAVIAGARFHRQQDFIDFAGPEAEARADCAYLLRGRQHADTNLVVNHAVPHCTSRETFKCVMDERARGAFAGRIHVAPDAQKTDGRMAAHGLLLGEAAEFDAKPELEIYADDVVCAHGATVGALDEEQLFYLRARGVTEQRARAMLIAAFVAETFDDVENASAREALRALAEGWLDGEGAA